MKTRDFRHSLVAEVLLDAGALLSLATFVAAIAVSYIILKDIVQ